MFSAVRSKGQRIQQLIGKMHNLTRSLIQISDTKLVDGIFFLFIRDKNLSVLCFQQFAVPLYGLPPQKTTAWVLSVHFSVQHRAAGRLCLVSFSDTVGDYC